MRGLTSLPVLARGRWCLFFLPALYLLFGNSFNREPSASAGDEPAENLSSYGLFKGNGATQEPDAGVVPYDINTPLFSDHAAKYRFVRLPPGKSATYDPDKVFDFPVGTIIAKTFAYPKDFTDPSKGRRLIETRLLIHKPQGWVGLPYIWNDEQTEATLELAGGIQEVRWIHSDRKERTLTYLVPNANQCMGCHENNKVMRPIGPRARNLNKDFDYTSGKENQLVHWQKAGILNGAPRPENAPRLPVASDPATGTLEQRARAWLDINCAHCHNSAGPARTSGLDLSWTQRDPAQWGAWKTPVAAGKGSGGRFYDIVPGKPDASILVYRIESTELGVLMPELSRRMVDQDGVALIREWIASLRDQRAKR
jgi:uncharacterized repeat protein (TIGR03806 family)